MSDTITTYMSWYLDESHPDVRCLLEVVKQRDAEIERLRTELEHYSFELERDGSRPVHRKRRAHLARKALEHAQRKEQS